MLGRDGRLIVGGSAEEGQGRVLRVVLGLGYLHGEHLELTPLGSSVRAREDPEDECMLPPITLTLSQPVSSALVLVLSPSPPSSFHPACLEGRACPLCLSALRRQISP